MSDRMQRATVEIDVSVPVTMFASEDKLKNQIVRELRLNFPDDLMLHPPLLAEDVTLKGEEDGTD